MIINSFQDLKIFLEADRISLNRDNTLKNLFFNDILIFQRLMRILEYLTNCSKNRFLRSVVAFFFRMQSRRLGFSIPINVFGPGLSIAHPGTIIVNGGAKVGANCRLHVCVVIGTEAGKCSEAPIIGDNCYIGPGAKIFGKIMIGNNTAIGANAVVNSSYPSGNVSIGGIPAKVISNKGSSGILIEGYSKKVSVI